MAREDLLLGDICRSDVRHVAHHIIWQHLRAVDTEWWIQVDSQVND